jgi:hypothetical protein
MLGMLANLSVFLPLKNISLPVVLCGCETWSLTLKEDHTKGVQEPDTENAWTYERASNGRMEKTA